MSTAAICSCLPAGRQRSHAPDRRAPPSSSPHPLPCIHPAVAGPPSLALRQDASKRLSGGASAAIDTPIARRDDKPTVSHSRSVRRFALGKFINQLVQVTKLPHQRVFDILDAHPAHHTRNQGRVRVDARPPRRSPRTCTGGQMTTNAGSSKPVSHWITWSSSAFVRPFLSTFDTFMGIDGGETGGEDSAHPRDRSPRARATRVRLTAATAALRTGDSGRQSRQTYDHDRDHC